MQIMQPIQIGERRVKQTPSQAVGVENSCLKIVIYVCAALHFLAMAVFMFLILKRLVLVIQDKPNTTVMDWIYIVAAIIVAFWKIFNTAFIVMGCINNTQNMMNTYTWISFMIGTALSVMLLVFNIIMIIEIPDSNFQPFIRSLYITILVILVVEFLLFFGVMFTFTRLFAEVSVPPPAYQYYPVSQEMKSQMVLQAPLPQKMPVYQNMPTFQMMPM